MMQIKINQALLRASFLFLILLSACATPAARNGRVGLLDRIDGKSSNRSGRGISNVDESELSVAPTEGAVLGLTGEWQWPLKNVEVSSNFGERGRKFHQGSDFRAPVGTPVYAASDGRVIYVGSKVRGYGRMVVIKHTDNIHTVYGHNSKNLVKSGAEVKRGDLIAFSGKTGHVTGPHLHFEIRKGTLSYDPVLAINDRLQALNVDRRFASVKEKPARKKRRSHAEKKTRSSVNKTASINKNKNQNL